MNERNINYNIRFPFYNEFVNPKRCIYDIIQSNRLPCKAVYQINHYIAQQRHIDKYYT